MKIKNILIALVLFSFNCFAQYTSNDKELVYTTYKREFDKNILAKYIHSNDTTQINAAVLSIANSGDSLLASELLEGNNIDKNQFLDFALLQTKLVKNEYQTDSLLKGLLLDHNFKFATKLYRMEVIPGDKEIYVTALKKALTIPNNRAIPYLLGCLRKLKYFPDDEELANKVMKLKSSDKKIEAVKVLPFYVKTDTALSEYLKFFNNNNQNIVRQAAISISEITEKTLFHKISAFLMAHIKTAGISYTVKNEMLLSYIKINKPAFNDLVKEFHTNIDLKGWIIAAQNIGDKESKEFLLKNINNEDYHIRLNVYLALDELNKDSSLTIVLNQIKEKDKTLKDLLDETARPRGDFEKIWNYAFKYKTAIVYTTKWDIQIKLLPEYAPMSVGNFCKLAKEKFFNGNLFHRVVPGFVIQTGDTTNTGWGGPGYSIVSEVSPLTFSKRMVGMASSGKDTEGSQWFVTTGNYPHLDGKYSVFGEVISGVEAEVITPEEKIISIELH